MKDSLQGGEGGGNTVCRVGRETEIQSARWGGSRKYSLRGGEGQEIQSAGWGGQEMKKTIDDAVQEKKHWTLKGNG